MGLNLCKLPLFSPVDTLKITKVLSLLAVWEQDVSNIDPSYDSHSMTDSNSTSCASSSADLFCTVTHFTESCGAKKKRTDRRVLNVKAEESVVSLFLLSF